MFRKVIIFLELALLCCADAVVNNATWPYELLKKSCITPDCNATRITISNPPINLWNAQLIGEFNQYLLSINNTDASTPKIVVISSDVADFYMAAIDLHILSIDHPVGGNVNTTQVLDQYYENLSLLTDIGVVFVGEVSGAAWGAGDEHLMHMDMRFAGPDAIFSAPEASIGLIHVGALQWLVESVGPSRTMEYLLSSAQVNATEASRIGWVNSAFTTTEGLRDYVDALVTRISKFDATAIRATKKAVSQQKPTQKMFETDQATFGMLAAQPAIQATVDKLLSLSNDQSKVWELNNSDNIVDYVL